MVSLCGRGFDSHQVHILISKEILSNRKGSFEAWFDTVFLNSIIIELISNSSQKRSGKTTKTKRSYYFYYHNKFNFVLLSLLTFLITALFINTLTCQFEWQEWQENLFSSNVSFETVPKSNPFPPYNILYKMRVIYVAIMLSDAQSASSYFVSFAHHVLPDMPLLSLIRREDSQSQQ